MIVTWKALKEEIHLVMILVNVIASVMSLDSNVILVTLAIKVSLNATVSIE